MADETYTIDLDVDSRGLTVAEKRLKTMQKRLKKIHAAEKRLASTRRRAKKLQDSRHLVVASRRLAQVKKQTMGLSKAANASSQQANAFARQADSMRAQSDRILARSASRTQKRMQKANALQSRNALKVKRSGEIAQASSMKLQNFGAGALRAAKGLGAMAAKAALVVTAVTALGATGFARAVIGAKEFQQTSEKAFSLLTGGAAGGADVMGRVDTMADRLGLTIQDTSNAFKSLLAAQFSIDKADTFVNLGADLKAIGASTDEVRRAFIAIGQIKAVGTLTSEELNQLSEAKIGKGAVKEQLALALGVDVASINKMMKKGEITAEQGLSAIQATVLKLTGKTKLGDAAAELAQLSIESAGNRIRNSLTRLFQDVANTSPDAFEKLALIGNDLAAFFTQMDRGKLSGIFQTTIDVLGMLVKTGEAFFSGFIDRFGEGTEGFSTFSRTLTDPAVLEAFQDIGKAFAAIADHTITAGLAFTQFVTSFNLMKDLIDEKMIEVELAFETFGFNIAQGVATGIKSGISSVISAASSIAQAAKNQFTSMLRIGSPSKVFEGFGANVVEGFDKGVQTPAVKAASNGTASAGGGSSVSNTTNNFSMGGVTNNTEVNEASDGPAIASQMEQSAMGIFGQAFEKMALAGGTA